MGHQVPNSDLNECKSTEVPVPESMQNRWREQVCEPERRAHQLTDSHHTAH
jgi:hypothetical protein